ncbi:Gfo/Idh/MocA family protein [Streptosporangium sp. KLBMP 9127]|nr:Gfo/Idh/MocA family oxidoreductase [Streptosporangium sp. KLBMP 9127]
MRIAFAGLATSHPYTDARTIRALTGCDLVAWEPEDDRLATFTAEHPEARRAADLSSLLATEPDGVVISTRPTEVADTLAAVLAAGIPCFVNKPAATTAAQLARLADVVAVAPERVMTTSVLRFAPAVLDLGRRLDRAGVLAVRATVRHDVGRWLTGGTPWQDDPEVGGGAVVTMGLHGVELLVALFGPDVRLTGVAASVRRYAGLRSEDTAVITLEWSDGLLGTVEMLGVAATETYRVTAYGKEDDQEIVLPGDGDMLGGLGYRATIDRFLEMVGGAPSPVPWRQTHAVLSLLADASARARSDRRA